MNSELAAAVRYTDQKIEAIAAELVRSGVPLYEALERARRIYQAQQVAAARKEMK